MSRVTLNTNIYTSALVYGRPLRQLLRMAEAGAFRLQLSQSILDETAGVLEEKFHWHNKDIQEACSGFLSSRSGNDAGEHRASNSADSDCLT